MTLSEYTQAIFPIIKAATAIQDDDSLAYGHILYLYRQSFYGFEEFGRRYYSVEAQKLFSQTQRGLITQRAGREQREFDRGKRDGEFHFEHVYTGTMFRLEIVECKKRADSLQEELTPQAIEEIVRNNYSTAWILKSENRALDRSGFRSKGVQKGYKLADRLQAYAELGIVLKEG